MYFLLCPFSFVSYVVYQCNILSIWCLCISILSCLLLPVCLSFPFSNVVIFLPILIFLSLLLSLYLSLSLFCHSIYLSLSIPIVVFLPLYLSISIFVFLPLSFYPIRRSLSSATSRLIFGFSRLCIFPEWGAREKKYFESAAAKQSKQIWSPIYCVICWVF